MKRVIGLFAAMLIFSLPAWTQRPGGGDHPGGGGHPAPAHGPEPQRGVPNQGSPQHNTRLRTYVHVQYFG